MTNSLHFLSQKNTRDYEDGEKKKEGDSERIRCSKDKENIVRIQSEVVWTSGENETKELGKKNLGG